MSNQTVLRNRFIIDTAIKCAHRVRQSGSKPTLEKIIAAVTNTQAPCYFASYDRALRVMQASLAHNAIPQAKYARTEMWQDMFKDLRRIMKRRPKASIESIVTDLVSGNAGNPRVYASTRSIRSIISPYLIQIVDL